MSTADVKQQFQITRDGLRTLKEKNTNARQAMENGDQAIKNEVNLINEKISLIKGLVNRSNEIDAALKAKEEEVTTLQKELEETKKEFTTTREEKEGVENNLRGKEEDLARLTALMAANQEQSAEKDRKAEALEGEINQQRVNLEQVNTDLQEILAEATQLNADLATASGEVDQLNEYNTALINNINELLKKVNVDLQDILNAPPPSSSNMSQTHAQRLQNQAAAKVDTLEEGELGNLFDQPQAAPLPPPPPAHENTLSEDALHAEREARRQENGDNSMNMDGMQDMFAQQSQPEQFNEQPTSSSIDSVIDQGPEVEQVNIPSQDELNPTAQDNTPPKLSNRRKAIHLPGSNNEWMNWLGGEEQYEYGTAGQMRKDELEQQGKKRRMDGKAAKEFLGGRKRRTHRKHSNNKKSTRKQKARRVKKTRKHNKKNHRGGYVAVFCDSSKKSSRSTRKSSKGKSKK